MSLRYGNRYSWYEGLAPDSGRYRFTRKTTSRSAISILPLHRLPLCDFHGNVIDSRRSVRAVRQRVLQVIRIVAVRIIRAAVGPAGLATVQRAVSDRCGDIEHEVELENSRQLRVEHPILVRH